MSLSPCHRLWPFRAASRQEKRSNFDGFVPVVVTAFVSAGVVALLLAKATHVWAFATRSLGICQMILGSDAAHAQAFIIPLRLRFAAGISLMARDLSAVMSMRFQLTILGMRR
jgi:hypothetical protein